MGDPLVHGDVSPLHIQFDKSGKKQYLIDWSSAGALSEHNTGEMGDYSSWFKRDLDLHVDSEKQSKNGLTQDFCAPEILNLRQGVVITPKADTYSFAATAYYMLTKQHPFLLDMAHLSGLDRDLREYVKDGTVEYVPLSERELKDLPEGVDIAKVDRAIKQALSFKPEDRQDVADFYRQAFVESINKE